MAHDIAEFGPPPTGRMAGIDAMRLLAVAGVVLIHASQEPGLYPWPVARAAVNQAGRFAIPFFFATSGYFWAIGTAKGRSAAAVAGRLWRRILPVWLAWSAVYLLLDVRLRDLWDRGPLPVYAERISHLTEPPLRLLLVGPAPHLWFLVSLLLTGGLFAALGAARKPGRMLVVATPLYVLGCLAGAYKASPIGLDIGLNTRNLVFFSALPAGLGAAAARWQGRPRARVGLLLACVGAAMHVGEVALLDECFGTGFDRYDYVFGTAVWGFGMFLLALSDPPVPGRRRLARLGRLTLGLYVLHPLVWSQVTERGSQWCRAWPVFWAAAEPALTFALTLALVAALARVRSLRRFVA